MVTPTAASIVSRMRLKRQLSKTAFAELIGLPASTITRIESGAVEPTYAMLQRIALGAGFQLTETLSDSGSDLPYAVALDRIQNATGAERRRLLGKLAQTANLAPVTKRPGARFFALDSSLAEFVQRLEEQGRILLFRRWRLCQVMFPRPVPSLPSCMWTILKS
nr:helix-turn-helix transcriptional regulator [Arthrobacter polaris]